MAIVRQTLVYQGPGGPFEGVVAYEDEVTTLRPGVLVLPNVLGQKEADNVHAENLAKLGYVALAADVYGQGKRTRHGPDAGVYMNQLNADRALLRDRLAAALAALAGFDRVDPAKLAAIGFCFGGKCVLDMARSGLSILGARLCQRVADRGPAARLPWLGGPDRAARKGRGAGPGADRSRRRLADPRLWPCRPRLHRPGPQDGHHSGRGLRAQGRSPQLAGDGQFPRGSLRLIRWWRRLPASA
jgi:dienelactone hydrolase